MFLRNVFCSFVPLQSLYSIGPKMGVILFFTNLFKEETEHKGSFGRQTIKIGLLWETDERFGTDVPRRSTKTSLDSSYISRLLLAHKNHFPLRFPRFFGPVEGTKLDE